MEKKYIHKIDGIKCIGFEKGIIEAKLKHISFEPGLWLAYSLNMGGSDDGSIDFERVDDIQEISYDDGLYLIRYHSSKEVIEVLDFCIIKI